MPKGSGSSRTGSGSATKSMCQDCLLLQSNMQRHVTNLATRDGVRSKHADPQVLPLTQQRDLFREQRREIVTLRARCDRFKRLIEEDDMITVERKDANEELYGLHLFLEKNFDALCAAIKERPLLVLFLKDQLKSALQDNKPSKHSAKGMRWSQATYQFAIHLACSAGSKFCKRINDTGIIKLPNDRSLKLKRYDFQSGQGVTKEYLTNMMSSVCAHRAAAGLSKNPFLCVKLDEVYIKNGIVFNPSSNKIIGVSTELDSGDYLNPYYELADAMKKGENIDKQAMTKYSAKIVVQTVLDDFGSTWKQVAAYWMFKKNAVATQLYNCIVRELLFPMHVLGLTVFLLMMDMSSTNISFAQLLSGTKTSRRMLGKPILCRLPFEDHDLAVMFDPQHCLKSCRNQLYKSRHKSINIETKRYFLQDNDDVITWEHIEQLYEEDLDTPLARHRSLNNDCVYLNPWSKQRVNLALQVFDEKVVSGLKYRATKGHNVKGTLKFIEMTRLMLVGSFVAPSKNDHKFARIYDTDNELLPRLDAAWKWFDRFEKDNCSQKGEDGKSVKGSSLPVKTLLSLSSIRFGFEWVVSEFEKFNGRYGKELDGGRRAYLSAYSFTTNDCEMFFSTQRGSGCDRVDTYDKGVGMSRMRQDNRLQLSNRQNHNSMSLKSARRARRGHD